MAGTAGSAATASDLFVVRTGASPAAFAGARRIGEPAADPLGEEAALDLHRTRNALPLYPAGSLALTGRVGRPGTVAADAFLLVLDPVTLKPITPGFLYGDHDARRDAPLHRRWQRTG